MTEEIRKKLAGELLRDVHWDLVKPHVIREAVFQVIGLPLIDVGTALASDDGQKVAGWVEDGRLARPDRPTLERWRDEDIRFATLIVSPFVLVQEEPVKLDGVRRLCWGPVDASESSLLVGIWPSPIEEDICFKTAGFDEFGSRDSKWDEEFEDLVGRLANVLSDLGEPVGLSAEDDLKVALLKVTAGGSEGDVSVHFGEGIELRAGHGLPIFWLTVEHHREVSMDVLLRRVAVDLRIDRQELDWKALVPPQLQPITGLH